jgi:hypothetical protein
MDSTLQNIAAKAAQLTPLATCAAPATKDAADAPAKAPYPIALVHEITLQNGSWRLRRGQDRIRVRVSVVQDPQGCLRVNSRNVLDVLYESGKLISGTTERSSYYPGPAREEAARIAAEFNARRAA